MLWGRIPPSNGCAKKSTAAKRACRKTQRALKSQTTIAGLDKLFKRICENIATEKLTETRFQMLADDYVQEQAALTKRLLCWPRKFPGWRNELPTRIGAAARLRSIWHIRNSYPLSGMTWSRRSAFTLLILPATNTEQALCCFMGV